MTCVVFYFRFIARTFFREFFFAFIQGRRARRRPGAAMAMTAVGPLAPTPMVDPSLLECAVCISLLTEPVTIGCGHTFCRSCLVRPHPREQTDNVAGAHAR